MHAPADVRKACEQSLKLLGLKYLDLYLIHWPMAFHHKEGTNIDFSDPNCFVYENVKLEDTWKARFQLSVDLFCSCFVLGHGRIGFIRSCQVNRSFKF